MIHPTDGAYATVRELYAVKDALLAEMQAMEARLTQRIDAANTHHDGVHEAMRTRADDRHRRIDDYLRTEETADALAAGIQAGRTGLAAQIVGTLRLINEFRGLLLAAAAVGLVLFGGVDVTVR